MSTAQLNLTVPTGNSNFNFLVNSCNVMSLLNNGNVGIGITNPITLLHLYTGNNDMIILSNSSQFSNANIKFINNATSNAFIGIGGTSTSSLNSSYANNLFLHSGCNIILNAGNNSSTTNSHLFIYNNGNIGIGTTNSITYNLTVNGTIGTLNNNNIYTGSGTYYGGLLNLTSANNDMISLTNSSISANANIKFINSSSINSYIGLGGTSTSSLNSSYANNLFLHSTSNIIINAGNNSSTTNPNLFISKNSNIGIGISNFPTSGSLINAFSCNNTLPRITLTGTEFLNSYTSNAGIAQILGMNRVSNRQLWIGDTELLTVNTTNPIIRLNINPSTPTIAAIATDGTTFLDLGLGSNLTLYANGVAQLGSRTRNTYISGNGSFDINSNVYINTSNNYNPSTASGYSGYGQSLTISGGIPAGVGTYGVWGQLYIFDKLVTNLNYTGILFKADSNLNYCSINSFKQSLINPTVPLYINDLTSSPIAFGGTIQPAAQNTDLNISQLTNNSSGNINLISYGSNASINFFTNNSNNRLTILSSGLIGINTNSPSFALDVNGTNLLNTCNVGGRPEVYFNANVSINNTLFAGNSTNIADVVARFIGSIVTTSYVLSSSDFRIKTNINNLDNYSSLNKILSIEVKKYNYKDIIQNQNKIHYGFIAQQIKEIIPDAITLTSDFIPNIYSLCSNNSNTIIIPEIILSNNNININDEITIINGNNYEKNNYIITNINSNQITINENLNCSNCFVYGTKVNDYHVLNKDSIYVLNTSAIQELYKIIQEQKKLIDNLYEQINTINQILKNNNLK